MSSGGCEHTGSRQAGSSKVVADEPPQAAAPLDQALAYESDLTLRFSDDSSLPAKHYMLSLASPVLRSRLQDGGTTELKVGLEGLLEAVSRTPLMTCATTTATTHTQVEGDKGAWMLVLKLMYQTVAGAVLHDRSCLRRLGSRSRVWVWN